MRLSRLSLLILAAGCGASSRLSAPVPASVHQRVGQKALRESIDSVVNSPEFSNGHWGVLVVTTAGDTLYSRNAGKLFMPASNQKLLTSAVALAQLGPDYRYRTVFVAHGVIADGVLEGDLGVIGRGDPSVSDHMRHDAMLPLREMADSLSARGIRRIRGHVVAEGNAFPDAVLGFGWSWSDLESDYSAATDELLFNEGFSTIVVRAGRNPGDSVQIETRPTRTWPKLRASVTTVARPPVLVDSTLPPVARPGVVVRKDTLTGDVIVTGTVVAGDSVIETVTHRDPDAAYIAALREALVEPRNRHRRRGGFGLGDGRHRLPPWCLAAPERDSADLSQAVAEPDRRDALQDARPRARRSGNRRRRTARRRNAASSVGRA